jgi:hypothetical protein
LAYLATGAHDNNPAIRNNGALSAAVIQLTESLNFIVQQLGQNSGLGNKAIGDAIGSLLGSFGNVKFEDFTSSASASPVPAQAKELFDAFTPFLNTRAVELQAIADRFDR